MTDLKSSKSKVILNIPKSQQESHVAVDEHIYEEEDEDKPVKNPFILVKLVKSGINFFFDFLETIVVALSVFVVVYLFLVQPHEVKGSSMEPSFLNNQYIITDKISYRFGDPQRGDVIIFKAPVNPDVDYIKRIIGLPGDKVMITKGKVFINGKMISELYLADLTPIFPNGFVQDGVEIDVPQEHYFVMGDNRPHSSDSREFGPISKKLIIGRAIFRYWPVNDIGVIPHVNYRFGS